MKNLLKSTLYLSVFALAGILFQISCSNSENQSSFTSLPPSLGKIIYFKRLNTSYGYSIYTRDYDGTNESLVNVTLPSGVGISYDALDLPQLRISPDGQTVFFVAINSTSFKTLYSCDITGANLTEVISLNGTGDFKLGNAY